MLYTFVCHDKPGTLDKRLEARPAHIARLKELEAQSRLVLAGPNPAIDSDQPGAAGFTGSLIVAEFDNLQSAEAWADKDPYISAGVYDSVNVKPFIQALPNSK